MVERVARAVATEIGRQDYEEINLGDDLKLAWLDQGEVDFVLVARAAIEAMHQHLKETHEWYMECQECAVGHALDAALNEQVAG